MTAVRTPRPYQVAAIQAVREAMRHHRRVLLQLPTGAGKTFVAATVAKGAHAKGRRVVFLVHRAELVDQTSRTFAEEGIPHGVIAAGPAGGRWMGNEPVIVASVQTLARRLDAVPAPDLLFVDEAHHAAAGTWQRILNAWPEAWAVGLTATPERLDGRGLVGAFEAMVTGPSVAELIRDGYLATFRAFAPSTADLSGCRIRMGEFAAGDVEAAMDRPSITGDIVSHYQRLAESKRAVLFAASVAHSQHLAEAFQSAGIPAAHVDGETPRDQRRQTVADFAAGRVRVLCNVELFGEGFDVPGVEAVILARPTQSLGLYLQQVGRALRPAPGKDHALILDHVGNIARHGLPDDPREWSLDAKSRRQRKTDETGPMVRQCPECFAMHRPAPRCPECGHSHEAKPHQMAHADGDLVEVDPAALHREKRREQGEARSLDDLVRLARARGFRNPHGWAHHVLKAREAKGAAA
ncbi:MAG: DEAD/DEAH box helicase [Alphaproteobacteria bacterium]